MQATAGNQATSRLIARDAAAPEATRAGKSGASAYALTIAGYGRYEVTSFHMESQTKLAVVIASFNHSTDPTGGEPLVSIGFDAKAIEFK